MRGFVVILFITDRFTKLAQIVRLRHITAYDDAISFTEHWVFKYGVLRTLLSANGAQIVAHFFRRMCKILGVNTCSR